MKVEEKMSYVYMADMDKFDGDEEWYVRTEDDRSLSIIHRNVVLSPELWRCKVFRKNVLTIYDQVIRNLVRLDRFCATYSDHDPNQKNITFDLHNFIHCHWVSQEGRKRIY